MSEEVFLTTERVLIRALEIGDQPFILELVNTEGWLEFIGDRNVHSLADAKTYIENILAHDSITYWVVQVKHTKECIGIVTLIKRDYLPHKDIGFAFLPRFCGKGYAYEATMAVLHQLVRGQTLSYILATTVPENVNSIKLLKKMGLVLEKEIQVEAVRLQVYGSPTGILKR